jgi:hypothetical protein
MMRPPPLCPGKHLPGRTSRECRAPISTPPNLDPDAGIDSPQRRCILGDHRHDAVAPDVSTRTDLSKFASEIPRFTGQTHLVGHLPILYKKNFLLNTMLVFEKARSQPVAAMHLQQQVVAQQKSNGRSRESATGNTGCTENT